MVRLPALRSIALALAATCAGNAHAGTFWVCGLSDDLVRLVCIADDPPTSDAVTPADLPTAQVNGTRFPLDSRGRWVVDLWSPPTERESVLTLARATICYRSPGCEVTVQGPGFDAIPGARRRVSGTSKR
ncbi:MAG: hypothetical protein JNL87_13795 [Burkholderiaceae bacterium]|nr:hypothetical protein [Burkholderiaceae bacterium]